MSPSDPRHSAKSSSSSEERFLTLETKVSYQDKLIAELNEVLLSRGQEVDSLLRRVEQLERLLREGPAENPANEPPPHY